MLAARKADRSLLAALELPWVDCYARQWLRIGPRGLVARESLVLWALPEDALRCTPMDLPGTLGCFEPS